MLLVADHHLGDPDLAGLLERLDEQAIGLLGPLRRQEVVRLAEVDGVDLVEVYEIHDVDGMRELDVETVEVLVIKRHVTPLLDLEAADDVVGVYPLAVVTPDLLVGDRRQVLLVEEVKTKLLRFRRREHPHGNADETERDRATPDRPHGERLPEWSRVSTRRGPARYWFKGVFLLFERLLHPAGGRLFGPVFRPEVVLESGDKAVDVVERRHLTMPQTYRNLSEPSFFPQNEPVDSGVNAQRAEFGSAPALQVVRRNGFQVLERFLQTFPQEAGGFIVIHVGAALGLGDDPVDDAELEAMDGVRLERRSRLLRFAGVPPEDGRATFGRDDGVDRVLLHQHAVGERSRNRTAGPAFADHAGHDRNSQSGHQRL